MSKLNPEDLNVMSFETAGGEATMLRPPVCPETTVSQCNGPCDSTVCSYPEPLTVSPCY
jgi:hypothetical protein